MRRTWRFLPSRMAISSQRVGMLARKRMGGSRGHSSGSEINRTRAGRVFPSDSSTPRRSRSSAASSGSPSTCTQ